jgi:hypothetical protein
MKIPILIAGGALALAASIWCVKQSMGGRAADPLLSASPSISSGRGNRSADRSPLPESLPSARNTTAAIPNSSAAPTPDPIQHSMTQAMQPATPHSASSPTPVQISPVPMASYANAHTSRQSASISVSNPAAQPTTSAGASSGTHPSAPIASITSSSTAASSSRISPGAPLPNGNAAAPSPGFTAFELDPGVPAPAALMTPQDKQPPTVAAAQQQLADSFVQNVSDALSQPAIGNNDAAASKAYNDSLNVANEQYRALYGDAAYNRETMRATLEAKPGN